MADKTYQEADVDFKGHNDLRKNGEYTDLKIEASDGQILEAHRAVLVLRMPLFKELLSEAAQDGPGYKLSCPRFPGSIIDDLLNYIYTGVVTLTVNNVQRIYLLAFSLQCDLLCQWCLEYMQLTMQKEMFPMYLEMSRILNTTEFSDILWSSLSPEEDLPAILNANEIVQCMKSPRMAFQSDDRLLELICFWVKANEDNLREGQDLLNAFKNLLTCIDTYQLSQSAIDRFYRDDSLLSSDRECRKHFNAIVENRPQKSIYVLGHLKETNKEVVLQSLPQFRESSRTFNDIRLPYFEDSRVVNHKGLVYVIGGSQEGKDVASVMTVDVNTGTVTNWPELQTARSAGAVAASRTEIFVCGGLRDCDGEDFLDNCECLRPDEEKATWKALPPLKEARCYAKAVVVDSRMAGQQLLVTGGVGEGYAALSSVELLFIQHPGADYETSSTWRQVAPMNCRRHSHGIALFRDKVLVAGGFEDGYAISVVEMFTTQLSTNDYVGQWTELKCLGQSSPGWVHLAVWQDRLISFEFGEIRQIEELFDETSGRKNASIQEMKESFSWRPIGIALPENLDVFVGIVVV